MEFELNAVYSREMWKVSEVERPLGSILGGWPDGCKMN